MNEHPNSCIVAIIGGQRAETLQKVNIPILDNKQCQQWFVEAQKKLIVVDTCMCAGFENGGKDACQVLTKFICKFM